MVKVPFDECLARPSDVETYLLKKHLENVGTNWSIGKEYEQILFFIGGLCHDIGKAQSQWQAFVRENNKVKKPNHSKIGSLIFAYLAQKYLQIEKLNEKKLFHLIMTITYDISSHHGDLKDVNFKYPPWHRDFKVFQGLESIDLKGFEKFIYQKLPMLEGKTNLEIEHLKLWGKSFVNEWKSNLITRETFSYHQWKQAAKKCLRQDTASFIYADRFDAAGFKEINKIDKKDFKKAVQYLEEKCKERAGLHGEINILREKTQTKVLEKYIENEGNNVFTLFLPTGYGKTIAALKVALNACHNGKTNRIIYIAPYLSILSQATEEIEKLTSMEVLQQHHLSIAESEEIDERKLFILDTWQAAIVTSTLNQLFKTVFPKRAQHTMRLESLKNSFIIIDEPQIITPAVWNAFLLMMDILTQKLESKVLFITATMPPTKYGLITKPVKLEPDKISWLSRYEVLLIKEPWDENVLTDQVSNELRKVDNIAVVVNTIKDSINIYRKLKEKLEGQKVKIINLHGNMLPGHKSRIIEYIKHVTKNSCDKLILVSTQIIEAGIDLSFDTIFRALPITPSVGQTAGRVNRHNEREKGKVIVFKFLRNGEEDTRKYIYKDKDIRKVTDEWFSNTGTQTEKELYDNIKDYYEQTFARNEQMKSLNYLVEAANGKWSSIAKLSLPFDEQYKKHEVFVPTELYINEKTRKLMEEFGIDTPKNVYKHYQNREWLSKLDFLSIKRFMGLMGNFVVNINEKTFNFLKCNGKIQEKETTISLLKDIDYYSKETGFGEITF